MRNSSTLDGYNAIETQEMRQRLISAVCRQKSVNYTDHAKLYSHIFVIDEYKFMYCAVRKVASITWKHVIDDLKRASKRGSEVRRRLLSSYTDGEIQQRLKFYTKFMFVREPLQRVFSAWKDKFQSTNRFVKSEFEHMVGPLIVKKIRQENLPRDFGILFSQRTPNLNVTFVEFVRYLTEVVKNVEEEDMHWNPYHHRCHPCHVQYDFIGHYETLNADADELLRELQISHLVKFPVGQSSSSSQAVQHYAGIEDTVVERLAELYRSDYEIFGYSIEESLKLFKL
ncbi:carbohydrate sulfotransferase 10-like [Ptychodera flava]|uniref:carbohydrate sulfotransferase 10-like n=1 Tax=Ptychodera flava TaxID=63121 RepID=UPI00396A6DC0